MLRPGQKIGKYKLKARISNGPFATVYRAYDTLEGVHVALKIPHKGLVTKESLEDFSREVRLAAKLDHPNILGLKSADFIDGHLVIAFPLGEESLEDRLARRLSLRTALDLGEQLLRAVAFAHEQHVIHCDVKPDNLLLVLRRPAAAHRLRHLESRPSHDLRIRRRHGRLHGARASDGPAVAAVRRVRHRARAVADVLRPTARMAVRMAAGRLRSAEVAAASGHDRAAEAGARTEAEPPLRGRRPDAGRLPAGEAESAALPGPASRPRKTKPATKRHWKEIRQQQFLRQFGRQLETHLKCCHCEGPVAESMQACPWCGTARKVFRDETAFPAACPRCNRGTKLDWRYCPWCYGPGFEDVSPRHYSDRRYNARCRNPKCDRQDLMPFMRYCPWCHTKVRQPWKIEGSTDFCRKCGQGVLGDFWTHCPWCAADL